MDFVKYFAINNFIKIAIEKNNWIEKMKVIILKIYPFATSKEDKKNLDKVFKKNYKKYIKLIRPIVKTNLTTSEMICFCKPETTKEEKERILNKISKEIEETTMTLTI